MAPSGPAAHGKAVARCRRLHGFFFLDLPKPIRNNIYTHLFSDNTIQVCSWAKEYDGDFDGSERCQILLTCRTIAKEAGAHLYFHTRWKFASISSLLYFTWHDVHPILWTNVTTIIFTRTDILPEFMRHLDKFGRLRSLTIDSPSDFCFNLFRRPKVDELGGFVAYILSSREYLIDIHPYTFIHRKWDVCIAIKAIYGNTQEEASLLSIRPCSC